MHDNVLVAINNEYLDGQELEKSERSRSQSFERLVDHGTLCLLDRYNLGTEDPEFLEFINKSDEVEERWNGKTDCIMFPSGGKHEIPNVWDGGRHYEAVDGVVYEVKHEGTRKRLKRTKRAKRLRFLTNHPVNRIYKDVDDLLDRYYGYYNYYENEGGYGYYENPDGRWDWYDIGGRWPFMFLVREVCPDVLRGDYCSCDEPETPNGYNWVAGARVKDIQWDKMREIRLSHLEHDYEKYRKCLLSGTGTVQRSGGLTRDDAGILSYGIRVFRKDDSLEDFLNRNGFKPDGMCHSHFDNILTEDGWTAGDEVSEGTSWLNFIDGAIKGLDREDVLVSVDYHF